MPKYHGETCLRQTTKGDRCSNNAKKGSDFCGLKAHKDAQPEYPCSLVTCGQKFHHKPKFHGDKCLRQTTKGDRCSNNAKEGSDFCGHKAHRD